MNSIYFSWPEGREGALTTSWDDGTKHDRRLVKIFNKHGIKATWNLNSRVFDHKLPYGPKWPYKNDFIHAGEVPKLFKGHEVAAHAANHPFLWRSPDSMILSEMIEDRKSLERLVGYPVQGMALPCGGPNDERVKKAMAAAGIRYSRPTANNPNFELPSDFMYWIVTCHQSLDFNDLWQKFLESKNPEKLFYLWGHSYEFDRDDNWERMDDFGKLTGRKKNIWYATNIEVYDYVTAWRSLQCSIEMTQVKNCSGLTVWFKVNNKKLVKVLPGKVLSI